MRNTESPYLHVTHPIPISSLALFRALSDQLHLPLVPLAEWTTRLEAHVHATPLPLSASKLEDPALTMLRHLQSARDPTTTDAAPARIFDHPRVASDEAWLASPTLHGRMDVLGSEDVKLWLRHWREVGIIPGAIQGSAGAVPATSRTS